MPIEIFMAALHAAWDDAFGIDPSDWPTLEARFADFKALAAWIAIDQGLALEPVAECLGMKNGVEELRRRAGTWEQLLAAGQRYHQHLTDVFLVRLVEPVFAFDQDTALEEAA